MIVLTQHYPKGFKAETKLQFHFLQNLDIYTYPYPKYKTSMSYRKINHEDFFKFIRTSTNVFMSPKAYKFIWCCFHLSLTFHSFGGHLGCYLEPHKMPNDGNFVTSYRI